MSNVQLILGDCLDILPTLPAQSADAIITDLPYGTTQAAFDVIIPFAPMWEQVKRILKPRGVFVTTASQPFTSKLVMSNLKWFRYEWIWEKHRATGFLDCDTRPLREHENIEVFSANGHTYNPQMVKGDSHSRGGASPGPAQIWGKFADRRHTEHNEYFPRAILEFKAESVPDHPTQKPVALYEYLILTYTNPGETVLDFAAGSGTTGVAAVKTGRNAILVEKRQDYFDIAQRRVKEAQMQPNLFEPGKTGE